MLLPHARRTVFSPRLRSIKSARHASYAIGRMMIHPPRLARAGSQHGWVRGMVSLLTAIAQRGGTFASPPPTSSLYLWAFRAWIASSALVRARADGSLSRLRRTASCLSVRLAAKNCAALGLRSPSRACGAAASRASVVASPSPLVLLPSWLRKICAALPHLLPRLVQTRNETLGASSITLAAGANMTRVQGRRHMARGYQINGNR